MSRPKGSKNKPKLTTESVGAESALTYAKDTPTCAKNATVGTSNTSTETSNVSIEETIEPVKKKRHRRTKAEMEAYRASLKVQSTIPGEFDPEKLLKDNLFINENDSKIVSNPQVGISTRVELEAEINPEIKINNLKNLEDSKTQENQSVQESSKKKSKQTKSKSTYPLCDCCHKEIYCQPHRIDTNMITAQVADYHRESPRWVNLCSSCAKKLSDTVDNWLRENGCITRMEQRMLEKGKQE